MGIFSVYGFEKLRHNGLRRTFPAVIATIIFALPWTALLASSPPRADSPVLSLASGNYNSNQVLTLTDDIPGAVIYYTVTGSYPNETSVSYSGPIVVAASMTVKAIAVAPGFSASNAAVGTYVFPASAPVVSPAPGSYSSSQTVRMSSSTPYAKIYYTVDGSSPSQVSLYYTGPFLVTSNETVQAVTYSRGYTASPVVTSAYTILTPAPTITPGSGKYYSAQSISIADAAPAAAIYYTTDGSLPTASSTIYTGPIAMTSNITVRAVAVSPGDAISSESDSSYNVPAPTPAMVPAPGSYSTAQIVTITDAAAGAVIYYTTDGDPPTNASTVYVSPVTVAATEKIRAIAYAPNYDSSRIGSAIYTISAAVATPVISPAAGTYLRAQSVSLADATPGATIYYTTDGSTPTSNSTRYSGPIAVAANARVAAVAIAADGGSSSVAQAAYTITLAAATPLFSPGAGTYYSVQSVAISDSTPLSVIYYTTDGSTPSLASQVYLAPIRIAANQTLQALALAPLGSVSTVGQASYSILLPAASPAFSPGGGSYSTPQAVGMTDSTPGSTIYYTTDGSNPTVSSLLYQGPITVSGTETLRAIAVAPGGSPSTVSTAAYTLGVPAAPPFFSPSSGSYASAQWVTIKDATPGAAIYYTTDGSDPSTSSALYSAPVNVQGTETIRAIAVAGAGPSPTASASYVITDTAVPVITPPSGTYNKAISVVIADATPGATLYYTTNGTLPSTSSPRYIGPMLQTSDISIRALAVGPNGPAATVPSASYHIFPLTPASPVFASQGGRFTTVQSVAIAESTPGASIYFTTDGSDPTANSTLYTGPVTVASTQTIRAIAIDSGTGLAPIASSISSLYFYIVLQTETPVISPAGGTYNSIQTVTLTDATPGAVIYYQLGGGYPSTSSAVYTGPIHAPNNTIIRTLALAPGNSISGSAEAAYSVVATAPAITPSSGSFTNSATVTMSDATPGATIYYTTDGSTPTQASLQYSGPIRVVPHLSPDQFFQAIAVVSGYATSAIGQAQFTITLPAGVLATASLSGGPPVPIPGNFLGIGHDIGTANQIIGQASTGYNAAYRNLLANLARSFGGPISVRVNGDKTALSDVQSIVEPLSELAQNVNVQLVPGVDMYYNDPVLAESEAAAYASGIPAKYINAIELGNEPDAYYRNAYHLNTYSFGDYLNDAAIWDQSINAATGGQIPIMECAYASLPWLPATEAAIGNGTFLPPMVSQHYYVTGSGGGTPDVLLQPDSATAGPLKYAAFAAAAHQGGLLFRMGELNSVWGGGEPGISDTFSSALWSIDTSFEYLNNGMDGLNWYSSNYAAYQLFEFKSHVYLGHRYYTLNLVSPLYYGLLAFAQVAGHGSNMLTVDSSTAANVKIWATKDNTSTLHVTVINKDEAATGDVQIKLPQYTTGTVRYLIAPTFGSTSGVTLAGQTFDNSSDGTIRGQFVTTTITASGGTFTLPNMPVTSAAFIDFSH